MRRPERGWTSLVLRSGAALAAGSLLYGAVASTPASSAPDEQGTRLEISDQVHDYEEDPAIRERLVTLIEQERRSADAAEQTDASDDEDDPDEDDPDEDQDSGEDDSEEDEDSDDDSDVEDDDRDEDDDSDDDSDDDRDEDSDDTGEED